MDTPRTHKKAHIFLLLRVVRDGQGEPAPTLLIPSPSSLVRHFSGAYFTQEMLNLDSDSMDI